MASPCLLLSLLLLVAATAQERCSQLCQQKCANLIHQFSYSALGWESDTPTQCQAVDGTPTNVTCCCGPPNDLHGGVCPRSTCWLGNIEEVDDDDDDAYATPITACTVVESSGYTLYWVWIFPSIFFLVCVFWGCRRRDYYYDRYFARPEPTSYVGYADDDAIPTVVPLAVAPPAGAAVPGAGTASAYATYASLPGQGAPGKVAPSTYVAPVAATGPSTSTL